MLEALRKIFMLYRDAVLVIENDVVVFANAAAQHLYRDNPEQGNAADYVRPEMLSEKDGNLVGIVTVRRKDYTAVVCHVEEYAVVTVGLDSCVDDGETLSVIGNIGGRMAANMMEQRLSTGKILRHINKNEEERESSEILARSLFKNECVAHSLQYVGMGADDTPFDRGEIIDVCQTLQELTESLNALADADSAGVRFEARTRHAMCTCSERMVEEIVLYLLSNSLKYTGSDGKILVTAEEVGKNVVLRVRDNGRGIPEDRLANIFCAYKNPPDMTDPKQGIGLGLAAVKTLVKRLGGTVIVVSKVNVGTTVTVSIPSMLKNDNIFHSPPMRLKIGSLRNIQMILSDVLPRESYGEKYGD